MYIVVYWKPPLSSYAGGVFIGAYSGVSTSGWSWPDGTELPTTDELWGPGEPDNTEPELCSMMTDLKDWELADVGCDSVRPFVCEGG